MDAQRLVGAWNERQARRMPMLFSPTIGPAITDRNRSTGWSPRLVNAVFEKYEALGLSFSDLRWGYWHALCATPDFSAVHLTAIEMPDLRVRRVKARSFSA